MNFKINGIIAAAAAIMLTFNLNGCNKVNDNSILNDREDTKPQYLTYNSSKVTVEEIKSRYDEEADSLMPLYNVDKDKEFVFDFKSDLTEDSSIGLYDAVTVHTDKSCTEANKIYYYSKMDKSENGSGSVVKISPMEPILKTNTDTNDYVYNNKGNWGSAPILYLAVHYDQESDGIKKLDKPIIIPFTVKSDVEVPDAKGIVSSDGVYKLKWNPVEGADHYIVYQLTNASFTTGENNPEIDGAKNAYSDLYLIEVAETDKTEFSAFSGEEGGTSKLGNTVLAQNYSVNGNFYVTAVSNGKESNLSAACITAGLSLPFKIEENEDISSERYDDISNLPLELNVRNIDGSISKRKVIYTLEPGQDISEAVSVRYSYVIEGTALKGYVAVRKDINDNKEYPETIGNASTVGNSVPEDNINKVPDSSVDTIIKSQEPENEDSNLITEQKENTKSHTEAGNSSHIETPEKGVYINADSPEEEWLALNMVSGENDISVEAFPKLQNPYTLQDTFYKVYYQNPYILGICSFSYDYKNLNFKVDYIYDKSDIKKKQKEIYEESSKIIDDVIKDNMSADEKRLAIYKYLEDNAEYDMEALEDCESKGYVKQKGDKYEDSFNAYGIIVNKKGVCMSYAEAYKLLCDLSGVDCIVATGYLDGSLPHAWNMVKIDDQWYQVDSTNNEKTSGVPYFLYEANSEIADKTCFKLDDLFGIDEDLEQYASKDDEYEYYTKNKMSVKNMDEYKKLLEKEINKNSDKFIVRYLGADFKEEDLVNVVRQVFNEKGLEDKLCDTFYIYKNGFLILSLERS